MSFMKPEVFEGEYYRVETSEGTWIVPADDAGDVGTYGDLRDYVQGDIEEPDAVATPESGWLCRLSAPGYLDCTEWDAFGTEQEAREHLLDMYDICPDCGEDMGDADECPECSDDASV